MEVVLVLIVMGLVIGALARLALPGPDPMPIWATILLGIAGALVGGIVGNAFGAGAGSFVIAVLAATLLLFLYRRLVQKRGVTGPGAHRVPGRDDGSVGAVRADPATRLERLRELRDAGLISEDEYELKRSEAVDRL